MYELACERMFSVLPGMKLLSPMVILCFTLYETAKLLSTAAETFYIPSSNV